jgi:hypothetical protein
MNSFSGSSKFVREMNKSKKKFIKMDSTLPDQQNQFINGDSPCELKKGIKLTGTLPT